MQSYTLSRPQGIGLALLCVSNLALGDEHCPGKLALSLQRLQAIAGAGMVADIEG